MWWHSPSTGWVHRIIFGLFFRIVLQLLSEQDQPTYKLLLLSISFQFIFSFSSFSQLAFECVELVRREGKFCLHFLFCFGPLRTNLWPSTEPSTIHLTISCGLNLLMLPPDPDTQGRLTLLYLVYGHLQRVQDESKEREGGSRSLTNFWRQRQNLSKCVTWDLRRNNRQVFNLENERVW